MDQDEPCFFDFSCGKSKTKGPKVLENDFLKHSANMNIVRKKMMSEHRSRNEDKSRNNLKSSENHGRFSNDTSQDKSGKD